MRMARKRVSFISRGKRVSFYAKSTHKRRPTRPKRVSRTYSRRNSKTRRDAESFVVAASALVHPAAPAVITGARLLKDLMK
jgi:hypothetical protein